MDEYVAVYYLLCNDVFLSPLSPSFLSSFVPFFSLSFSLSLTPPPSFDPSFPHSHCPQTTQSTDLQSLIGWLLDHTNLEVPEVDRPSLPPIVPEPSKPSSEEPAAEGAPELSESSSDSSDYSDDSEEDESGTIRWSHSHTRVFACLTVMEEGLGTCAM